MITETDRTTESWLATVAASVAGHVFTATELVAHAQVDAALRVALRGLTAQQLGKRLRSLTGQTVDGLQIQRIGRDNTGTLWTVKVVPHLHAPLTRTRWYCPE